MGRNHTLVKRHGPEQCRVLHKGREDIKAIRQTNKTRISSGRGPRTVLIASLGDAQPHGSREPSLQLVPRGWSSEARPPNMLATQSMFDRLEYLLGERVCGKRPISDNTSIHPSRPRSWPHTCHVFASAARNGSEAARASGNESCGTCRIIAHGRACLRGMWYHCCRHPHRHRWRAMGPCAHEGAHENGAHASQVDRLANQRARPCLAEGFEANVAGEAHPLVLVLTKYVAGDTNPRGLAMRCDCRFLTKAVVRAHTANSCWASRCS